MNLCKYRNILGRVNKGIHKYKLFGISIVDVLLTIGLAYLISIIFNWNYWYTLLGLFILGIILHRLFCVNTTINVLIFGRV